MNPRRARRRHLHRLVTIAAALAIASPALMGADRAAASDGSVTGHVHAFPIVAAFTLTTSSIQVGQTVKAEARITNIGTATLRGITVEIRADRAGLAVKAPLVQIGSLKPGKSTTVTWSVCGRTAGSYVLLVHVTQAGTSIDSVARLLLVTPGGKRACS